MMDCKIFLKIEKEVIHLIDHYNLPDAKTQRLFLLYILTNQKSVLLEHGISEEELDHFDTDILKQLKENIGNLGTFNVKMPKFGD